MRTFYLLILVIISQNLSAQLTCDDEFNLTGNASMQGECIRLTNASTTQQGCMWLEDPVNFNTAFSHTVTINLGNNDAGADGICLVYQSNSNNTCGINGGGIGAEGIPNSFIVEFDTWDNGAASSDIANDHASVDINGDLSSPINGPFDLGNIEDGADHDVTFSWVPGSMTYSVFFDGSLILSGSFDIINNCFGGNPLGYWGFTSSTGAAVNNQSVCPGLPPEIAADAVGNAPTFEIPCAGASITLDGSFSDSGPDVIYEWTTSDGNIVSGEFTTSPVIDESGTYLLTVFNTDTGCENTDEVTITQNEIEAEIDIPNYLDCLLGEVTLSGDNSTQGNNIIYEWTTDDGNIVSTNGDEATVDQAGNYTLTVIYDDGNSLCSVETTIEVIEDPDVPVAFSQDATLNCDPPFIELDGSGSSEGNSFEYEWTTDDGIILNGENSLFPLVSAEGTYTLVVTNSFSGCSDEYDIFVSADQEPPVAHATTDEEIGCGSSGIFIDGSQSASGNTITYEWTTGDGNIVSGADEHSPFVDQAGTYHLIVTDTNNGCSEETNITVNSNNSTVEATITATDVLSCVVESIPLDGSNSTPSSNVSYSWSTVDGFIIGNNSLPQINAGSEGTYQLIVTDESTGCTDDASFFVTRDITPPIAEAGTVMPFECGDTSLDLNGMGSTPNNASYQWTSSNGQLLSGTQSLTPTVGNTGTYFLEVTNNANGCTAIDSVIVIGDVNIPIIQITLNDTLDCLTDSLLLNASMSSNGANFSFSWTTSNGNITSASETLMPYVDAPGSYQLSITNTTNGCSNNASILVTQDTITPSISILPHDSIDCVQQMVSLIGSSPLGDALNYEWTTLDGNISSGADSLSAIVSTGGSYLLSASNPVTGCTADLGTVVFEDQTPPVAMASADQELNCITTSLMIDGSLSSTGNHISYQWTTSDGQFVSTTNVNSPTIDQQGTYHLLVTNSDNECTDETSVMITSNTPTVIANIAPPNQLTCVIETITLDGNSSSPNTNMLYSWLTTDGLIIGNNDMSELTVGMEGIYQLIATESTSGCADTTAITVSSDLVSPIAEAGTANPFHCGDTSQQLNGAGSSTNNVSYLWTSPNGQITSNSTAIDPVIGSPGIYILEVTNDMNGCTAIDSVTVSSDTNIPIVEISLSDTLDCTTDSLLLDASTSSNGNNFSFTWSTPNGNISSGSQTLTPFIDEPGSYQLFIINNDNDCSNNAFINVVQDTISPDLSIVSDAIINCNQPIVTLEGNTQSDAMLSFQWSTMNGNIDSGANSIDALISTPGNYELMAENTLNGCRSTSTALVSIDTIAPMAVIAAPNALNCFNMLAHLDGSSSSGNSAISFLWSSMDGAFNTPLNMDQAVATQAGTYTLTVSDDINGCTSIDSVIVLINNTVPIVEISLNDTLDCTIDSLILDASTSSSGSNFSIRWSTVHGNFSSGSETLTPYVDAPGTYQLLIQDLDNECFTNAFIYVDQDTISPDISILSDAIIDCNQPVVTLESNTQSDAMLNFQWSTMNGNIDSGANSLHALISTPGNYELIAENNLNGCRDTSMALVTIDTIVPMAIIAAPNELNCTNMEANLDGSTSSGNATISYLWSSMNGTFNSPLNADQAIATQAGMYTLMVSDDINGCRDTSTVEVIQNDILPTANIPTPQILNCNQPAVNLEGMATTNSGNIMFSWTTLDGNIVMNENSLMPSVDAPGTYTLMIEDTDNNCTAESSILVLLDNTPPLAAILNNEMLTCELTSLSLLADNPGQGNPIEFSWSTADGNITGPTNEIMASVNSPGLYQLEVTNTNNGCSAMSNATVLQDITPPVVQIELPETLTCATTLVSLNGSGSIHATDFSFSWDNMDGNDITIEPNLNASVSEAGEYILSIINTNNGCSDFSTISVADNFVQPIVNILESDSLDCSTPSVILEAIIIGNNNVSFSWTTTNGHIASGGNSAQPMVNQTGVYTTEVTDLNNGCSQMATTEVFQDEALPVVQIAFPETLTCAVESLFLDATLSSTNGAFIYTWSTTNGHIVDGGNSLQPLINTPGLYTLEILNEDNGCSHSNFVTVPQNIVHPVANAGLDTELNCLTENAQLNGASSTQGGQISYLWTSTNGAIITNSTSLLPIIQTTGTYTLEVSNLENGCSDIDEILVFQNIPTADIEFNEPRCYGETGYINVSQTQGGTPPFLYSINGGQTFQTQGLFTEVPAGQYNLIIEDINSCVFEELVEIDQPDSLIVLVTEPEIELNFGDSITLVAQSNFPESSLIINWQHDGGLQCDTCLVSLAKPQESTQYRITARTDEGCIDEAIVRFIVRRDRLVYIPTGFSPNGDGDNDLFYIFAKNGTVKEIRSLHIFSRWGEPMFSVFNAQPNRPRHGWDGHKNNQPLNSGVFVYVAEIEFNDGSVEIYKGDITIVR